MKISIFLFFKFSSLLELKPKTRTFFSSNCSARVDRILVTALAIQQLVPSRGEVVAWICSQHWCLWWIALQLCCQESDTSLLKPISDKTRGSLLVCIMYNRLCSSIASSSTRNNFLSVDETDTDTRVYCGCTIRYGTVRYSIQLFKMRLKADK